MLGNGEKRRINITIQENDDGGRKKDIMSILIHVAVRIIVIKYNMERGQNSCGD